jgi:hypothetical protein
MKENKRNAVGRSKNSKILKIRDIEQNILLQIQTPLENAISLMRRLQKACQIMKSKEDISAVLALLRMKRSRKWGRPC